MDLIMELVVQDSLERKMIQLSMFTEVRNTYSRMKLEDIHLEFRALLMDLQEHNIMMASLTMMPEMEHL